MTRRRRDRWRRAVNRAVRRYKREGNLASAAARRGGETVLSLRTHFSTLAWWGGSTFVKTWGAGKRAGRGSGDWINSGASRL